MSAMKSIKLGKRLWLAGFVILLSAGTAFSYCPSQYSCEEEDAYSDADTHPLRVISYALHPIGFAAEWLIARPLHALVSQPAACPVFGYAPSPWGCEDEFYPKMRSPRTAAAGPAAVTSAAPSSPTPAVSAADLDAMRRAVDEAKQAALEAKRAAEAAAQAAERSTKAFDKQLQK